MDRREVRRFYERFSGVLPAEELDRCLKEAAKMDNIVIAYLCAYKKLPAAQAEPQAPPQTEARAPSQEHLPPPARREWRLLPASLPWPLAAAAGLSLAALAALAGPLLGLASVPAVLLPRLVLGAVHTPVWREGDYVVASLRGRQVRAKAYKVLAVFRDVHGMGPYDYANAIRVVFPAIRGVYYDGKDVYVLLEDKDTEEARATLRRMGIVVDEKPSPPPQMLTERRTAFRYAPLAVLSFAIGAFSPVSLPALAIGALAYLALLARDAGTPAAGRGVERNDALYGLAHSFDRNAPMYLKGVAETSQLNIRRALLAWAPDDGFASRIVKQAVRQEHWGAVLLSGVRMLRAQHMLAAYQRIAHGLERAFAVAGLIEGEPVFLKAGRPNVVTAMTFDLAEFSPYSFMLLPFQCGEGAYLLGWDDRGREVCLDPYSLESPHAVVVGKTGSGKTTWSKAQALQAKALGRLVVAIDPHGHWTDVADAVVDARQHIPSVAFELGTGAEEFSDVDLLMDILRAAGVAVADVHYTVLLNALEKAGGSADLPGLVKALERTRDPLSVLAVDMILGRLKSLAMAKPIPLPTSGVVAVTTYGSENPAAVMRLVAWLYAYAIWAKQTCPQPPCPPRLEIYVDEAHLLLRNLETLALAWRGLRKYGVRLVAISQDVAEFGGPLSAIIANSDTKAVLAIDPTQLEPVSKALQVDARVLERVAVESVPEERHGILRVGGRAPLFLRRLAKPGDRPQQRVQPARRRA